MGVVDERVVAMGVVDERVVAISPGELLRPDAKVIIGHEWRRSVLVLVREVESRDVSQDDDGDSNEEEDILPQLPSIISVGPRHLSHLGHVDTIVLAESQKSSCE